MIATRLPERSHKESRSPQCTGCIGRSLNLCGALTDAQLPELVALGGPRQWRKRDILFRAGDPITHFFKITRGLVAVSHTLDDGRRQIVALRIAGDCVGYLHTDGRYTFEGHAVTDVEACTFSRRRFDELAQRYPALAAATAVGRGCIARISSAVSSQASPAKSQRTVRGDSSRNSAHRPRKYPSHKRAV